MAVDTRFLVDQFALCARYAALGQTKSSNSLLPQSYGRVQTSYLKQNRKETFAVAYGDVGKAYVYPESLQPPTSRPRSLPTVLVTTNRFRASTSGPATKR